jgi:TPR repeat protein
MFPLISNPLAFLYSSFFKKQRQDTVLQEPPCRQEPQIEHDNEGKSPSPNELNLMYQGIRQREVEQAIEQNPLDQQIQGLQINQSEQEVKQEDVERDDEGGTYEIPSGWQCVVDSEIQAAQDRLKKGDLTCHPNVLKRLFNSALNFKRRFPKKDLVPEEDFGGVQKTFETILCYQALLDSTWDFKVKDTRLNLGYMYAKGRGVQKNVKLAITFYTLAAKVKDPFLQHSLGLLYYFEGNIGDSACWFKEAKEQSYPLTLNFLAIELGAVDSVVGMFPMDDESLRKYGAPPIMLLAAFLKLDLVNCKQTIINLFTEAANLNFAESQYRLGSKYQAGYTVSKDLTKAIQLYQFAAEGGDRSAQYELGFRYRKGLDGVEQDSGKALQWLRLSAAQNYSPAYMHLSEMYRLGEGVEKDETEAARFLELSKKETGARFEWRDLPRPSHFDEQININKY